jgi:hypothetical protein
MKKYFLVLCLLLFLAGFLQGAESDGELQENKEQWVNEIQLSGTFRLGGKDFASLVTPEGNFWVEEGKFASGYKLIELDISQSQPSALIQKGDQQAWIGLRLGMPVPVIREVLHEDLEKREGVQYVKGETEPLTGTAIANYEDNSKWETPYKDGKMHGMQIVYRDEVLCEKRSYIDGKRDGIGIKYDPETGRKMFETLYENGKRSLRMKWDRFGKLVEKETY